MIIRYQLRTLLIQVSLSILDIKNIFINLTNLKIKSYV